MGQSVIPPHPPKNTFFFTKMYQIYLFFLSRTLLGRLIIQRPFSGQETTQEEWLLQHKFLATPRCGELIIYATADEADAYMFYRCFFVCFFSASFLFFFRTSKNNRQPFSGTAERIFMKLLPNDSGENVVFNVVPKWGLGPI